MKLKLLFLNLSILACGQTLVQAPTPSHNAGGSTTATFTYSQNPVVGNVVVVGVISGSNANDLLLKVTDNQAGNGNVYAKIGDVSNGGNNTWAAVFCSTVGASSGTFTMTATAFSSSFISIFPLEYSGSSCDGDQISSGTGATSPYSCGSLTTTNAKDLLITLLNTNAGSAVTFTAPSGFTVESSLTNASFQTGAIADKVISATAAFSPTFAATPNATSSCMFVAFKAKAAAGGGGQVGYISN